MPVNTRTISIIFFFVFSILLVWLFYTNYMNKDNEIRLLPNDLSLVTLGQNIYSENCASCHGINLEGQKNWQNRDDEGYLPAPPHDETGHTWHHSDEYLFQMTKYGIEKIIGKKYLNNMPAYENILTDKEIVSVLSFIKSTWPSQIQEIHNNINIRSKLNWGDFMFKKFLFIILIILPLSTSAHSPIANLIPSDGAVLTDAPKEIQIEFVNPAMFTKFEIINTENNNEKVDLPKEFLMVLSDKHTIKLPELVSGKYITDWRAMASDGHVIKGKFTFEIY